MLELTSTTRAVAKLSEENSNGYQQGPRRIPYPRHVEGMGNSGWVSPGYSAEDPVGSPQRKRQARQSDPTVALRARCLHDKAVRSRILGRSVPVLRRPDGWKR